MRGANEDVRARRQHIDRGTDGNVVRAVLQAGSVKCHQHSAPGRMGGTLSAIAVDASQPKLQGVRVGSALPSQSENLLPPYQDSLSPLEGNHLKYIQHLDLAGQTLHWRAPRPVFK